MRKLFYALLVLVGLVAVARLALPGVLLTRVNDVLVGMHDYAGRVDDVDVALLRGEYVLHGLTLTKRVGNVPEPFLSVERIDLGLDGSALLRGAVVADVTAIRPRMNFVDGATAEDSQRGAGPDWAERLNALLPFTINSFTVDSGEMTLIRTVEEGAPNVVGRIHAIDVRAENFSNVRDSDDDAFGRVAITGTAQESATLKLNADVDPFTSPPELNLDASLVGLPLTELNPLLRAYANIDASAGNVGLYLELASADGNFDGYVKPLIENAEILREGESATFFGRVWEGVVELAKNIFENDDTDTLGARVPLQGELQAVDAEVIPAIFSILENAFIEALSAGIGHSVNLSDVEEESEPENEKD